jgi:soluble lytic murein transglycosylase-like protein
VVKEGKRESLVGSGIAKGDSSEGAAAAMNFINVRVAFQIILGLCCLTADVPDGRSQGLRITDADSPIKLRLAKPAIPSIPLPVAVSQSAAGHRSTGHNPSLTEAVRRETAKYSIDPLLIYALIEQESGGKVRAVSPKGARGPMQLMPATAARFGVRNSRDIPQSVRGGVEYLVWLLDKFDGNVLLALAGYNAGEGAVEAYRAGRAIMLPNGRVINPRRLRTGGVPPYPETQSYVRSIALRYARMRSSSNRP